MLVTLFAAVCFESRQVWWWMSKKAAPKIAPNEIIKRDQAHQRFLSLLPVIVVVVVVVVDVVVIVDAVALLVMLVVVVIVIVKIVIIVIFVLVVLYCDYFCYGCYATAHTLRRRTLAFQLQDIRLQQQRGHRDDTCQDPCDNSITD